MDKSKREIDGTQINFIIIGGLKGALLLQSYTIEHNCSGFRKEYLAICTIPRKFGPHYTDG
jgi:hypothetical protein